MISTFKKAVLDLDSYCERVIALLESEQEQDVTSFQYGNYSSSRYHRLLPIRRKEDNVYFVAWINHVLHRNLENLPKQLSERVQILIAKGELSIAQYKNRYGEATYNFYRPSAWFPNGRLLSKFGRFQPTDDTDDTSIAFRGKRHARDEAHEVKDIYRQHANGQRGRWLRRLPKEYRKINCYSTWIGSDDIYIDTDIVVLSNILIFNALYALDICEEDEASLLLLRTVILNGDYLNRKWSLAAWYPFDAVILYSLADLLSLEYYGDMLEARDRLIIDLNRIEFSVGQVMERLLVDSALMKLGQTMRFHDDMDMLESKVSMSSEFSFGVIPLLHPWNGLIMQYLSSFKSFRLYYESPAQRYAILLENIVLRKLSHGNYGKEEKRRARSYKPDSVILNK